MNEEEKKAIQMLDKFITEHKFYNIKHSDNLEDNIEIVLNLIEKLQKENELAKQEYDRDTHILQNQLDLANAKNIEKDKIIDLMAEEISKNITNTCPNEDYNYDLDCENKCNDDHKECWKQYFENKLKEG